MKKVLIDTNIILDIALQRDPFFEDACEIFTKIDNGEIKGFVTASSISDIYYISKKSCGREKTITFIRELIDAIDILSVTKENIIDALNAEFKDFEDAIQSCVADMNRIDIIVTRNKPDFEKSTIEVYTPAELFLIL
jgi:predicted nucleic acid-binding protein